MVLTHGGYGCSIVYRDRPLVEKRCPRCPGGKLHSDRGMWRCSGCGGIWSGVAAFRQMRTDLDVLSRVLDEEGVDRFEEKKTAYLKCPACNALMARRNFGKRSGVLIDVCAKHGLWFDAGELRAVADFVQTNLAKIAPETKKATSAVAVGSLELDVVTESSVQIVAFAIELLMAHWT